MKSDGRCMRPGRQYMTSKKLFNELQCAAECDSLVNCSVFSAAKSNSSCILYSGMKISEYANLTYDGHGQCRLGLAEKQQIFPLWSGTLIQIITSTTTISVPRDATTLSGVCIGGGAGSSVGNYGGGGSGYISYGTTSVTTGSLITVTIGAGGTTGISGGTSSIGSYVVASGGSPTGSPSGGPGGSGGGCAGLDWGYAATAAGSGGSSGVNGVQTTGGQGQGQSVWAAAASYLNTTDVNITFGNVSMGLSNPDMSTIPGGPGAGGIIVNGVGISAGSSESPVGPGIGGYGYGAGGGGGGCYSGNCGYMSGAGAPGICILKFVAP